MSLEERIAMVTGAGRGLGKAIASKLAEQGATVLVADIVEGLAEETAADISSRGGDATARQLDVTDRDAVIQAVDQLLTSNGRLDILVNNAGINRDGMLHKLTMEQWEQVLAVNLTGTFNCLQRAAIAMREQHYGRIVNISSASWMGNIGQANYSASKAGVVGLTKTAARELARYEVTVNALCPGFIETDMTRGVPQKVWDLMVSKIPLGRVGQPEDVANVVAFLASDESAYVTGEVINVGGGMVL